MKKPNLQKIVRDVRTMVGKRSPEILIGLGITGMITTTVLAVRATPKALERIEAEKRRQSREAEANVDELKPVDVVKVTWKCYIPTAASAVFSTACIIGANSVNSKRNAALATAYKLSETAFTEYKDKVIETIGEKKEQTVREKVAKERVEKNPVGKSEVIITEKGNTLCLDPVSGRYFKSDIDKIKNAEIEINRQMLHDISGYASLNDFYDVLGLSHTSVGNDLGWNAYNLLDIDFYTELAEDNQPCIVLDYRVAPKYDYTKM